MARGITWESMAGRELRAAIAVMVTRVLLQLNSCVTDMLREIPWVCLPECKSNASQDSPAPGRQAAPLRIYFGRRNRTKVHRHWV